MPVVVIAKAPNILETKTYRQVAFLDAELSTDFCYTKKKKVFENALALVGVVSTSFLGSTLSLARGVEKELGDEVGVVRNAG